MSNLEGSKVEAGWSENSPFLGSHLGSMRITPPLNNGAVSSPSKLTPKDQRPFSVDQDSGEIIYFNEQQNGSFKIHSDPIESRLERWILQSAVKKLLPEKRVAKCCRLKSSGNSTIKVLHNSIDKTAHFGGLQTCGSVWDCSVCAPKISERRRVDEVVPAMQAWESQGGQVLLLTLTHPHQKIDVLADLLQCEQQAMRRFTGSRAISKLNKSIGFKGSIRAWEVTFGENGFHPHFHLLLFVDAGLDLDVIEYQFYKLWVNACRLAKLPIPGINHGVKLHDGSQAQNYVSKGCWGLDREITKGHLKKSKNGRSPVDLLRSYCFDDDKQAGALFVEYSKAFHGRRQLQWSPGLKAYFGIGEKSDDLIAAEQDDKASVLGEIDWPTWQLVLKSELRGEILELARLGSWEAITRLLEDLKKLTTKGKKS